MTRILVFIPTYDEVDNVAEMCRQVLAVPLPLDLHFTDDASPDGTGQELDRLASLHPQVTVSHRSGKLGIGTAHQQGIRYAYAQGYDLLVTMDCDFTHDPAKIPDLLNAREGFEVVLGSRFMAANSLPGWSPYRRFMTMFGHFLTRHLLRIKYDATGAFRLYDLRVIPAGLFTAVRSRSYAFFFESLFVLAGNGMRIKEIPVVLPSRTYGHSKLSLKEAFRSAMFLLRLSVERVASPGRFRSGREPDQVRDDLSVPQDWNRYWQHKKEIGGFVYETLAALYRDLILRPVLKRTLLRTFAQGDRLLHAGCGSGQVDVGLHDLFKITAIDISRDALDLYSRYNPDASRIEQASILGLPFAPESYDGIYNLGVMEHFPQEDILRILHEFHRVLCPGGKIVIFWPHRHGLSVLTLKGVRGLARMIWNQEMKFHPEEITLLASRDQAKSLFAAAKFDLTGCRTTIRDGFVQTVLTGQKQT